MGALRTAIPQHLRTFVEPQIEQLPLGMESVRCGLYATLPKSLGEGFLWTAALGEECLVSMHSIRLKKPLILEERDGLLLRLLGIVGDASVAAKRAYRSNRGTRERPFVLPNRRDHALPDAGG